jgi:hypothetical protein
MMSRLSYRFRVAWAKHRLAAHAFERLAQGGQPNCPCGRCALDRATLVAAGVEWTLPAAAAYYRDLERGIARAKRTR